MKYDLRPFEVCTIYKTYLIQWSIERNHCNQIEQTAERQIMTKSILKDSHVLLSRSFH